MAREEPQVSGRQKVVTPSHADDHRKRNQAGVGSERTKIRKAALDEVASAYGEPLKVQAKPDAYGARMQRTGVRSSNLLHPGKSLCRNWRVAQW
jgi:hypothetical protein